MTAIFTVRQRNAAYMMTDGAAYSLRTGILSDVRMCKAVAIPTLSAVIACTGPVEFGAVFGEMFAEEFTSFDHLIENIPDRMPSLFQSVADLTRGGDALSTMYLIGWHRRSSRPGVYAMNMWTEASSRLADVSAESAPGSSGAFALEPDEACGTPMPSPQQAREAGFRLPDDLDRLDPEKDLLHLLEIARQERVRGMHWVGGEVTLSSVDRNGRIAQRVVHAWPEDKVGKTIAPHPIDWRAWHAARAVASVPAVLSRLQRERMEKKARKGTR